MRTSHYILAAAMATTLPAFASEKTTGPGDASVIEKTPGLVAFWTFGEEGGEARLSQGTPNPHPLIEFNGPIPRAKGGPFSGYSADFDGMRYLYIKHEDLKDLNIHGKKAQVSLFAVVYIDDVEKSRTLAGIWSEGKGYNDDTGTRQWALLMHMPTYGGPRRITPHISAEGGTSYRGDGTRLPWNADYATPVSETPEKQWVTMGFTYDSEFIRAYLNGVMEPRKLDAEADSRTDRYFTKEGPDGKDRGMNPYYHGKGIFTYHPDYKSTKLPPSDFTVAARYAGGDMFREALRGRLGALAIFDRALTDEEMKALHDAARVDQIKP